MAYHWPADTVFRDLTLEVDDRVCWQCEQPRTVCCHRQRRFFTCDGPVHLTCKLCHCSNRACPGRLITVSPEAETALVMPYWVLGWDAFCWLGHRRFARHWSVPQIRDELSDRFAIPLSVDAIERYVGRYQRMLAARQQDSDEVAAAYRRAKGLVLSIDGLQPEKGHETLDVVREISHKRVWFAEALLSSSVAEVRRLLVRARECVERLGLPVRCWISDKQDAFVTGIAAEFPDVPHRYCRNHFLRDLAKPMLEADSHAKVQMRRKVRDLPQWPFTGQSPCECVGEPSLRRASGGLALTDNSRLRAFGFYAVSPHLLARGTLASMTSRLLPALRPLPPLAPLTLTLLPFGLPILLACFSSI